VVWVIALLGMFAVTTSAAGDEDDARQLFSQTGTDLTFAELMQARAIPVGRNSTEGVRGSTIRVATDVLSRAAHNNDPIPQNIRIHTLCNSLIQRDSFNRWTRWYQEDGNTQIFRLFAGEHNVRNDRPGAARIEAFTALSWQRGETWHEWRGTYTIIQPHGAMIFQIKNTDNDWAVSVMMNDQGDVTITHRQAPQGEERRIELAQAMVGQPFELGFRDNGHDYQVYYNGRRVTQGSYNRPTGTTSFRWGMYDGTVRHDAMLFVTGARFR